MAEQEKKQDEVIKKNDETVMPEREHLSEIEKKNDPLKDRQPEKKKEGQLGEKLPGQGRTDDDKEVREENI